MKLNNQIGLLFFSKVLSITSLYSKERKEFIKFICINIILLFTQFISCTDNITDSGKRNTIFPITPVYFGNPAWHPTSNWIAVIHSDSFDINEDRINDGYFSGVWLINAETGQKKPFLNYHPSCFSWSKDGSKLAMTLGGQIYTIDIININPIVIDTASLTQLTYESGYYPSFSPDGKWVVYDSRQDSPGQNYIWKMRSDGSEKKCISIKGTGEWRMPDWSPKENVIVHQRAVIDFGAEIYLMDTMGVEIRRLTLDSNYDQHPKFTKNGEVIGFLSSPRKGARKIRLINSDGTNLRDISPDWVYEFDFSPDDSKIAFVLWGSDSSVGNGQLWIMNFDGSGLTQLTNFKP